MLNRSAMQELSATRQRVATLPARFLDFSGLRSRTEAKAELEHLHNWDRLRLLAALDPLALHITGHHALMGFGLPMFLVLSVALSVSKPHAPCTRRFIQRRWQRIIIPWIFWSLIIAGLRVRHTVMGGDAAFSWFEADMLFYGPRMHLWFLPFIAVFGLAAHGLHKLTKPTHPAYLAVAGIGMAVVAAWVPTQMNMPWPYNQWIFALPTLPLGFALGRLLSFQRSLGALRMWAGALFLLYVWLGVMMYHWIEPVTRTYLMRFGGGFALLTVAIFLPNVNGGWVKKLAPLMLGMYVLHPAVFALWIKPQMLALGVEGNLVLRVVATYVCTGMLVAALRKTPLKAVL